MLAEDLAHALTIFSKYDLPTVRGTRRGGLVVSVGEELRPEDEDFVEGLGFSQDPRAHFDDPYEWYLEI